uniref:Reverse transcriptase domain-containing protein n=1 Tax=Tanacetum cinerariifolium TaxID=118510 RepID=A0A6L2MIH1_TANCI|nr:reverse transcriptase domain-containing protein [Tanacetum cinerariifolium]
MNTTSRENAIKSDDRIDKLADQISILVDIFAKKVVTPATVKAVEESCVTCGGNHAYYNCDVTNNQSSVCAATGTYNQVAPQNRASNYMAPPGFASMHNSQNRLNNQKLPEKATNQMEKFFQIFQDLHFDISFADALLLMPKFASTIKSLLTNKDKLFELAKIPLNKNCSAMLLKKLPKKLGDPGVAEDVFVKLGKFHFPTDFVVVDFNADPRVPLILGRSFLRTGHALIDVYGEEITLWVNDEAVTFNLNQTMRYSSTYDDMSVNRIDIIDVAREDDFILEEIEAYFKDESISPEIDHADFKAKSSIEEPPELELKDLPSHLEYAYLEGADTLPVIIAKDLKVDEKEALLKKLTEAPILVVPDWNLPFELMCDASDSTICAVLGQCKTKHFQPIHYASKTMTEAQIHYTITEKEMLVVVYAFENFWPYLVLSKSIVYTDHSALKYLLSKQDAEPRLLRWVLLLQEFDIIIRDKKGTENLVADHLSRLENPHKDVFENKDINENFPLETLGKTSSGSTPWFANFANFHAGNFFVKGMSSQQKKKFFNDVKHYFWDDPCLF